MKQIAGRRGRRVMAVMLAAMVALMSVLPVAAEPSATPISVKTTISRVFMKRADGVPYCDVSLANGRWLYGVSAEICNGLRRGQSVTLWYESVQVESQKCDWRGRCKSVPVTQQYLVSWY